MRNTITVEIDTSFKGEQYCYKTVVPVNFSEQTLFDLPKVIPHRLAKENGVDTYSYLFEAMEAADLYVVDGEGFVTSFLKGGPILLEDFIIACRKTTAEDQVDFIINRDLPELKGNEKLVQAMLDAYHLGEANG